jgi:hypothetical protein
MTLYLLDIASYQAGMDLAVAKAKGWDLVNIKTSQGDWYTHTAAKSWADKARALSMGICTFHWLDNSASGRAQADIAYRRMREIGGPGGMAHQLDCEDRQRPATQQIMRDYAARMQDLLGRHIVVYTGDWWWQPRGWTGASLTPYLWAAPNAGYLGSYPGDASSHWRAGYGGWGDYSVLQYAVSPISGAGGGNVSKSAIRDPRVWAALTGTSEDEMTPEQDRRAAATDQRLFALCRGDTSVKLKDVTTGADVVERLTPNIRLAAVEEALQVLPTLAAQVAEMAARPAPGTVEISHAELVAAVREVLLDGVAGAG